MSHTDLTLTDAARLAELPLADLEAAAVRLGLGGAAGRIDPGALVGLAADLGSPVAMGVLRERLAALVATRAGSPAEEEAALEAIDRALIEWVAASAPEADSFLADARRVLPDELYEAVAAVAENPGRGQRRPSRAGHA